MKKLLFLLSSLAFLLLAGCGAHMQNPEERNASLVYGYVDMDEAPSGMDYVTMRQYRPKPKEGEPYRSGSTASGLFWFDQLVPGSYQVVGFGGSSCWKNASYNYNMQDFSKNETAVVIEKQGLYFVGSYKYKKIGSFFSNKFDIAKVNTPTEKEVLEKLLQYSTGTQWENMIKKRIKSLK